MNKHYHIYLLSGILNWVGVIYVYKFAIIGDINMILLIIITVVMVFHGSVSLGLANEKWKKSKDVVEVQND
ncbi:hypothetical protein LCGC14_1536560 [marine sediment metagenome]|uniref:Uncharacterized protein n=1 Tax=marine sediment metagenome TaxID=412755 RepID=A0A0F9LA41_9ZZZZ